MAVFVEDPFDGVFELDGTEDGVGISGIKIPLQEPEERPRSLEIEALARVTLEIDQTVEAFKVFLGKLAGGKSDQGQNASLVVQADAAYLASEWGPRQ